MRYSLWLAATLCILSGCTVEPGGAKPTALSFPKAGTVRILPTKISDTPAKKHYRWDILGERNWNAASADKSGLLELSDTYPINTVTDKTGCFTWMVELTTTPQSGKTAWHVQLHGTNGTTKTADGVANGETVEIQQKETASPNIPAELPLAKIGDTEIRLRVADK